MEADLRASFGARAGLAPLPIRAVAKLIDALVFIPLFCVAVLTTFVSLGGALVSFSSAHSAQKRASEWLGPAAASAGVGIVAVVAWIAVTAVVLYQWHLLISAGQTIGKRFCGIRIVGLDGQPAGFFRALFLRNWVFITLVSMLGGAVSFLIPPAVSLILLVDWGLALSADRRCLHDYVAGTQVRWVKVFEVRTLRIAGALAAVSIVGLGGVAWVERGQLQGLFERSSAPVATAPAVPAAPAPVVPAPVVPQLAPAPAPVPAVAEVPAAADEKPAEPSYYRFVDGDGVTHVVDSLEQVPAKYRKSATVMKP